MAPDQVLTQGLRVGGESRHIPAQLDGKGAEQRLNRALLIPSTLLTPPQDWALGCPKKFGTPQSSPRSGIAAQQLIVLLSEQPRHIEQCPGETRRAAAPLQGFWGLKAALIPCPRKRGQARDRNEQQRLPPHLCSSISPAVTQR